MTYHAALAKIIETGLAAVAEDYNRPDQKDKLEGAIAGFNACAGLEPPQLLEALIAARQRQNDAHCDEAANYWWFACYAAEIEWVCNVVSAIMVNVGLDPITTPTARGTIHAAKVLQSVNAKCE